MTDQKFKEEMDRLVRDRLNFIAQNKEKLLEAWIAETGLLPSESVLVQQDMGGTINFWVRKKEQREADLDEIK